MSTYQQTNSGWQGIFVRLFALICLSYSMQLYAVPAGHLILPELSGSITIDAAVVPTVRRAPGRVPAITSRSTPVPNH